MLADYRTVRRQTHYITVTRILCEGTTRNIGVMLGGDKTENGAVKFWTYTRDMNQYSMTLTNGEEGGSQ